MALRGTLTHWKTQLLAKELGIDQAFALGLLESLWHVTAKETPTGCIGRLSNHGIAMRMFTSINPDKLIKALLKSGHLDKDAENGFIVHDWSEHSDDAVDNRLARHGLYYADGKQPRMRRIWDKEREQLCAKYGFLWVKREKSVRTEHHEVPRSGTEDHAAPLASSQKPEARVQNPVSTEALENAVRFEQSSGGGKSASVNARRGRKGKTPPAAAWPLSAETIRSFHEADDETVALIVQSGLNEKPGATDEEIAKGLKKSHRPYQRSAIMFLNTLPGAMRLQAASNGAKPPKPKCRVCNDEGEILIHGIENGGDIERLVAAGKPHMMDCECGAKKHAKPTS